MTSRSTGTAPVWPQSVRAPTGSICSATLNTALRPPSAEIATQTASDRAPFCCALRCTGSQRPTATPRWHETRWIRPEATAGVVTCRFAAGHGSGAATSEPSMYRDGQINRDFSVSLFLVPYHRQFKRYRADFFCTCIHVYLKSYFTRYSPSKPPSTGRIGH